MRKKGNLPVAVVITLVSVGAVFVLTEYGVAKGLPGSVSFVLTLAALFGLLIVKVKA